MCVHVPRNSQPARQPYLWILDVPYEERSAARAGGASWDAQRKSWVFLGDHIPPGLVPYTAQPYSWQEWRQRDANKGRTPPGGATRGSAAAPRIALRPHQKTAADTITAAAAAGARGFLLADDVGLGKAQPVSSRILTPGGFRALGTIRPGDTITGSDGAPTRVLSVHPQGVRPVHRVTFSDGATTLADGEHLWAVSAKPNPRPADTFTITTADLSTLLDRHPNMPLHIPLPQPVTFTRHSQGGVGVRWCVEVAAVAAARHRPLPTAVLTAPPEARMAALAACTTRLGRASRRGGARLVTTNPTLAAQLRWLAASLGGAATAHPARMRGGHVVHAVLPDGAPGGLSGDPSRYVAAIQPAGHAECVCIRVANADRLYITDGFIVTHNTAAAADAALRVAAGGSILVVSPLAVVPHWRRTLHGVGAEGSGSRICVINYDRLKTLLAAPRSASKAKRRSTKNRRTAREGTPIVDWDVVVFDEAHQLRNPDSQRSQAAARLAKYGSPAREAPFVLWMSATAGHNPTELSYLGPLLAQVTRSRASDLRDFGPWLEREGFHVTQNPRWGGWEWTEDKAGRGQDVARLARMLFAGATPVALRRLPTQISGWPQIQRVLLPVELGAASSVLYAAAWTEFRTQMRLASKGRDPKKGLAAQLRFRQKASLLRVPGTVGHIETLLDNGHQVAVSAQFLETVDALRDQLAAAGVPVTVLDGRHPELREHNRLLFQRGGAKVALFTPVEGFSLHAGETLPDGSAGSGARRSLIVHDPRYSGIQSIQIEGRTHRDGQSATVFYPFAEGTVEEKVLTALLDKMGSALQMVGDDTGLLDELVAVLAGG